MHGLHDEPLFTVSYSTELLLTMMLNPAARPMKPSENTCDGLPCMSVTEMNAWVCSSRPSAHAGTITYRPCMGMFASVSLTLRGSSTFV